MIYQLGVLALFPIAMGFAAMTDALSYKISNWVSLILVVGFIALVPFSGLDLNQILFHVGLAFIVLVIGFLMFVKGWLGGGDSKIIAAVALWLGPDHLALFLVLVGIFGGILSVLFLMVRKFPLPPFLAGQKWLVNWQCGTGDIPYGIAIGAAALITYPYTHWLGLS